ncbi:ErfK/YbiS/YcfS/YnhG family protein [Martelella endophytica]|uniref:ErfK/YbiS/YcfS/YnhG family protein n=1 Tax=Martelella endophytica TaxID=1486262 RepID=A0A0D5LV23_MAREN|nr:ErfK/YbiS/YcfS/YnhG family protein [Martelella endophytica]
MTVRAAPGAPHRAILTFGPLVFRAAIGRSGLTARKREGDGRTPIATMKLLGGYHAGTVPASALRLVRTRADTGWCDQPASPAYNRPVRLPFRASHERLMRDDGIYDLVIVIDWNITSRSRNRGSAVFFHLARPDFSGTAGCIAIAPAAMRVLLPHLRTGVRLVVRG